MSERINLDALATSVLEDAHRLLAFAIEKSPNGSELDKPSAIWVIRREAWRALCMMCGGGAYMEIALREQRNMLLSRPVRITIDDTPDTPMIQLLMEPVLYTPRKGS